MVLLGITRQAVMRMDPETKEVLTEYPLTHLKRWAASPNSFTMDFGDYHDQYYSVLTNEGEAISQLISGYIDIILKTRKDAARFQDDGDTEVALEEQVTPTKGMALQSVTQVQMGGGWDPQSGQEGVIGGGAQIPAFAMGSPQMGVLMGVNDMAGALAAASLIADNFSNPAFLAALGSPKSGLPNCLASLSAAANGLASALANISNAAVQPGSLDPHAKGLHMSLMDMLASARAAAENCEESVSLLDGAKALSDAVGNLLKAASALEANPKDPQALEAYRAAQAQLQCAQTLVQAASTGTLVDVPSQNLIVESAKHVAAVTTAMVASVTAIAQGLAVPVIKQEIFNSCKVTATAASKVLSVATALAPGIHNPKFQEQIASGVASLGTYNKNLCAALCSAQGVNPAAVGPIKDAARAVEVAINLLLHSSLSAGKKGHEPQDFITPVAEIQTQVKPIRCTDLLCLSFDRENKKKGRVACGFRKGKSSYHWALRSHYQ